jgi:hypothetical protein
VKYRGIFINDEDWGLHPWAEKTFDPQTGDIGPKTYAKVFELLLRLRANYIWPAMHPCTKAFNLYPQNKQLADDYAIVVGSSHCEQMLRNNISEWPKSEKEMWNPVTNLPAICDYWEQRVRENGRFESTWTLGMRGIHDSGMPGPGTVEEKRDVMTKIIAAQRAMLAKHVDADPSQVPQIFCPYKEVLDIYRAGLTLPDDVTIVWPDDNFGYIRQLPDASERKRRGRQGIYYHLSYYGRPHDYLWLESNSPALVWHQMTTAFEYGADRLWVVNVGDIKPAECGISFFLELAWDPHRFKADDVQKSFLRKFYAEQFGDQHADAIADVKDEYFRLCAMRKPEHFGYRLKDQSPDDAVDVDRWIALAARAEKIAADLAPEQRPAYFELVQYPACAAAAMVEKFAFAQDDPPRARSAYERIQSLTEQYNSQLDGKWRSFMDFRPRKLAVFAPPSTTMRSPTTTRATATTADTVAIKATKHEKVIEDGDARWTTVPGLGRYGSALAVVPPGPQSAERAPRAIYGFTAPKSGRATVVVEALPTQSLSADRALTCTVTVDDQPPVTLTFAQANDEHDATWSANIIRNAMFARGSVDVPSGGAHTLTIRPGRGGNLVLQRIALSF